MKATTIVRDQPYEAVLDDIKGQVVVVLGGATGIGLAIVEAFYARGAQVYSLGLTPRPKDIDSDDEAAFQSHRDGLLRAHEADMPDVGGAYPRYTPQFIECDVTKQHGGELDIVTQLRAIGETHGKIEVLVDSIGYSPRRPLEELTAGEIASVASRNSHYLPIALSSVKPWMQGGGNIVVIGSSLPHGLTDTTALAYGMSKAARLTAALGLARDLGQSGINICVVSPSHVPTENEMGILGAKAEVTREKARASRPNGADLLPGNVADYVMMAASTKLAPFMAGREHIMASVKGSPLETLVLRQDGERAAAEATTMAQVLLAVTKQHLDKITEQAAEAGRLADMLRRHGINPETGAKIRGPGVVSLVNTPGASGPIG